MKKFLFIATTLALGIVSCDKIKTPSQAAITTPVVDTNKYIRKVLIEDYTGHKCGNCPAAATIAEELYEQHSGKVVIISVHAGDFAKVKLPDYPTSYTTTVGKEWDDPAGFGISGSIGNPGGMINRKAYTAAAVAQKKETWGSSVGLALEDTYVLKLYLKPTYDIATRKLSTTASAVFKTSYANNTTLSVVLIEDSIVGPQTDYTKVPDLIPNYVFRYMLRGDINGSFGASLKSAPIAAKDSVALTYSNFDVNPAYNDKHVYVVAFVSDATTKEVLQVEKVKIR